MKHLQPCILTLFNYCTVLWWTPVHSPRLASFARISTEVHFICKCLSLCSSSQWYCIFSERMTSSWKRVNFPHVILRCQTVSNAVGWQERHLAFVRRYAAFWTPCKRKSSLSWRGTARRSRRQGKWHALFCIYKCLIRTSICAWPSLVFSCSRDRTTAESAGTSASKIHRKQSSVTAWCSYSFSLYCRWISISELYGTLPWCFDLE